MRRLVYWTPERLAEARALVAEVGIAAAAKRLGEGPNALRMALRDHAEDVPPEPPPPAPPPPPPEAPAWQGYRPRAGWFPDPPPPAANRRDERALTTLVLADIHAPYHHRPDLACATGIVRDMQPDRVVLLGDVLDLESLSRHPKSRPDLTRLSEELYAGNVLLDSLQEAAPNAEWILFEGNHEGRAGRYACEFGTLDGLLDVAVGLYLQPRGDYRRESGELRGMRWVPLKAQPLTLGAFSFAHGLFEGKYHATQHAEMMAPRLDAIMVTAHMHAWQASDGASGGSAYSCPWLGDPDAAVFRSYVKGKPRPWTHGVLRLSEAGPSTAVEHIRIANGRALVGGRVLAAA